MGHLSVLGQELGAVGILEAWVLSSLEWGQAPVPRRAGAETQVTPHSRAQVL